MKAYYIILKHEKRCIAEGILKIKNLICSGGGHHVWSFCNHELFNYLSGHDNVSPLERYRACHVSHDWSGDHARNLPMGRRRRQLSHSPTILQHGDWVGEGPLVLLLSLLLAYRRRLHHSDRWNSHNKGGLEDVWSRSILFIDIWKTRARLIILCNFTGQHKVADLLSDNGQTGHSFWGRTEPKGAKW